MSGGSYNYLYCKEAYELFSPLCVDYIEDMADVVRKRGYEDIARDLLRLSEYIKSANIRVEVLSEQLNEVMHAVEWWQSADYGDDTLEKELEKYRKGG